MGESNDWGSQGCPNTYDPGGDNILLTILCRSATIDKTKLGNRDRSLITKTVDVGFMDYGKPSRHSDVGSKGNSLNLFLATPSL